MENAVGPKQKNYLFAYLRTDMSSKKDKDSNIKVFVIAVLIVAAILVVINLLRQDTGSTDLANSCTQNDGTWIAEYSECEWISEETCTELGGTFNECDSACRHESEPVVCTMNCVQVCSF